MNFFYILVLFNLINNVFGKEIPAHVRLEYATQLNEAFIWQSQGHSTTAFAMFDNAYNKAIEVGESAKKLEPIRQLFIWYRTYGHYLGIMAPFANHYDKIYGEYGGGPAYMNNVLLFNEAVNQAKKDARQREYLLAVSEIISGLMGVFVAPSLAVKGFSASVAFDGGKRLWSIFQEYKTERDVAMYELRKITENINATAK